MQTRPFKYEPETLKRLIDEGLTNAEIARSLGAHQASINKRLNEIRKGELSKAPGGENVPIDLTLLDTVRGNGVRCRVIDIGSEGILLKRIDFGKFQTAADQLGNYITISRKDYASGKSGFTRVSLPRVTITKIER